MCALRVTDGKRAVPVDYNGVLPALFREGQGVVATGAMDAGGTFDATEVLAKHDEKYMPPEVVAALKRSGRWKEGEQYVTGRTGPAGALLRPGAVAGDGGARPDGRASRRTCSRWRAGSRQASAMGLLVFVALAFGTLAYAFVTSDFSIARRRQQFPHPETPGLQDHRRVGKP